MRFLIILLIFITPFGCANTIKITYSKNGQVKAAFHLDNSIRSLNFSDDGQKQRELSWKIKNPCLDFNGVTVRVRNECNSIKKFDVTFDPKIEYEADRVYSIGGLHSDGGFILNLSKFIPDHHQLTFRIIIKNLKNNNIYYQGSSYSSKIQITSLSVSKASEYIYLGQLPNGKSGPSIIVDPITPSWMKKVFRSAPIEFYDYFSKNLRIKYDHNFLVIVSYFPNSGANIWKGDVDNNGTIFLRFYGKHWGRYDELAEKTVLRFISHEIFHIFNAVYAEHVNSSQEPWLHEGSAEAFSVMSMYKLGYYSVSDLKQFYSKVVNECNEYHALNSSGVSNASLSFKLTYSCGALVNLLLVSDPTQSLHLGQAISVESMFKLWRLILTSGKANGYRTATFFETLNVMNLASEHSKALIYNANDYGNTVRMFLDSNHVKYARSFTNADRIVPIFLMMVLKQNCDGAYGFWQEDRYFKIQHNPGCSFHQDFIFTKLNGFNVFENLRSALLSINGDIEFSGPDGAPFILKNKLSNKIFSDLQIFMIL